MYRILFLDDRRNTAIASSTGCVCDLDVLWLNAYRDRVGSGVSFTTEDSYSVSDGVRIRPWKWRPLPLVGFELGNFSARNVTVGNHSSC